MDANATSKCDIVGEESQMKPFSVIVTIFVLFVALAFPAVAQETGTNTNSPQAQTQSAEKGSNTSMGGCQGMMQSCDQHMKSAMASNDQLLKTIDEAKSSNDPAKMRQALEDAKKNLTSMNDHMAMCGNMMGTGHMGGGMMGMHMGSGMMGGSR
jgi:hypothetical protein